MPPAVNQSNVKHYRHTRSITDYKEFPGRSHYIVGQDGWEEVADYAIEWAKEHATTPPGSLSVASELFTESPRCLFCELRPKNLLRYPYNGLVFGDTVRRARCAKGWSIPQLSKRSGVPGRLIREMEGGSASYVPSEANTVLLADALRLAVGPLLEERERLFEQWRHRDIVG
jgi:hypothetical protein